MFTFLNQFSCYLTAPLILNVNTPSKNIYEKEYLFSSWIIVQCHDVWLYDGLHNDNIMDGNVDVAATSNGFFLFFH